MTEPRVQDDFCQIVVPTERGRGGRSKEMSKGGRAAYRLCQEKCSFARAGVKDPIEVGLLRGETRDPVAKSQKEPLSTEEEISP